jgi:para-aminobenzoate synthetase
VCVVWSCGVANLRTIVPETLASLLFPFIAIRLPSPMTSPQILYVDAYDSFSNNIVALLRTSISANVHCVKIDDSELFELENEISLGHYLSRYDAVVVGPGPGNPTLKKDIGWIEQIWKLPDSQMLPVFGICLGFQSLCHAFGGQVRAYFMLRSLELIFVQVLRLKEPRHGLVLQVDHNGRSIFNRLEPFNGTMYHSLHVSLGNTLITQDPWLPSTDCPYLEPLAWDLQDVINGPVLMGVKHVSKPFCGVQFHPESVVTGAAISQGNIEFLPLGASLVQNWWNEAQHWNSMNTRSTYYESPTRASLYPLINCTSGNHHTDTQHTLRNLLEICGNEVTWNVRNLHHITVQHIFQELKFNRHEGVLLESGVKPDGSSLAKETGRYSIVGVVDEDTVRLQYFVKSSMIVLHGKGHKSPSKVVYPSSGIT